jgi:hypothetical protein
LKREEKTKFFVLDLDLPAIEPAGPRPKPRSAGATMGTTTLLMMVPNIWDAASV